MDEKWGEGRQEKNKDCFFLVMLGYIIMIFIPLAFSLFPTTLTLSLSPSLVHICSLPFLLFPVIFPIPHLKKITFKFTLVLLHITLCDILMNHHLIQVTHNSSFFTAWQRLLSKASTTVKFSPISPYGSLLRRKGNAVPNSQTFSGIWITNIHEASFQNHLPFTEKKK